MKKKIAAKSRTHARTRSTKRASKRVRGISPVLVLLIAAAGFLSAVAEYHTGVLRHWITADLTVSAHASAPVSCERF